MTAPDQTPHPNTNPTRIPIAVVYWGRLGAGAALMRQISGALSRDERFEVFASPSLQSELALDAPALHLVPIATFAGPLSFALRTLLLPFIADRLVRRLSAGGVRVIVTIMPHVWGLALQRAAERAGIATLLIVHDAAPHPGEERPLFDWLVKREIGRATRIVTFSSHVADTLIGDRLAAEGRIVRLYHPIFDFIGKDVRKPHPARPFRLLFFGRILPYKGVPLLLEAYALLRAAGVDCTLRVVGRGEIAVPDDLRRRPGLSIETGWVAPDAIGAILQDADAMVLPYSEASQSGVIAAAYGAGLPVVATPVGGLAEQVIPDRTGTLAGGVSPRDIADAIRRLIEVPGLYETCRAGVAKYADAHSPENFARALGDAVLATVIRP